MLNYGSTLISDCGMCTLKMRLYSVTILSVLSILYPFTASMFLNCGIASCDTNFFYLVASFNFTTRYIITILDVFYGNI